MENDVRWMERAILLSQKARFVAPPNPWVGCVIVRDDVIVGEGYSQKVGFAHAEVVALNQAGVRAKGATVYVTLEPCAHYGKTPPCSNALIASGISRAVIAVQDPDPRVQGRGIQQLKEAGIEVTQGVCQERVAELFRPYVHHRATGRPYCVVKTAVSIDGRIAAADGSSRWITCEKARADVHRLRAESQAVLIGAGTAIRDLPALTVRDFNEEGVRQPLRVVLDSQGRVPAFGPLFDRNLAPTLILTTEQTPVVRRQEWEKTGAQVVVLDNTRDLGAILNLLGSQGVIQVLVEGGPQIHSSFIKAGLVEQLTVYFGACLLGERGLPCVQDLGIQTIADAKRCQLIGVSQLGSTIRADYSRKCS